MKKTTKTIIAGTVGAAGLFLASTANASASTTVKVAKNDTVWGLAKKYNVSIDSIESTNHISTSSHLILQNQSLTIPDKSSNTTKTNTDSNNTSSVTVNSGDSLWTIAQKYGTTVANLQKLNGFSDSETLITVGQNLKVSGTATTTATQTTKTATTTSQVTVSANHVTYTVKSGDSLYTIAQEYGVSVDSLRSSNNLNSVLLPGQTLTINDPTKTPATTTTQTTATASTATDTSSAATTTSTQAASSSASSQATATSSSSAATTTTNSTSQATQSTQATTTTSSQTATTSTASVSASSVISYAEQFVGVPYVSGGTSPSGFDCSGFVQYVYAHFGVSLPRTSEAQSTIGSAVSVSSAQPGDLLFWGGQGSAWHVGIYVGGSSYIAAPTTGQSVAVKSFQYFQPSFAIHMN
ncbi:MAG: LysM peptidoglycan-binding domain-containing protein [Liquorilactobacillus nagelii]|uniref:Peptidoglycan endopeptidase n=2 Tax=Liquorilactobacillus nagelii TaxID=82688 RepID=A0A3Q8D179_9LACO|nr:C40 family peptidase [Liquorilactobacillus nagelii]AUJ33070.1 peptidoglycan endopeptidase [Liquorilactobacillus nagelii]MCC7616677.1 peptidoglycan endopeptidase [Liquorilactobacillus nagelii]MCP9315312.1 LysM peptidoglycan-binding domain-containing protein [Liquorilactobacillus nagelii]